MCGSFHINMSENISQTFLINLWETQPRAQVWRSLRGPSMQTYAALYIGIMACGSCYRFLSTYIFQNVEHCSRFLKLCGLYTLVYVTNINLLSVTQHVEFSLLFLFHNYISLLCCAHGVRQRHIMHMAEPIPNSLWRRDAICCHRCWQRMLPITACCLLGTNPSSEPMMTNWELDVFIEDYPFQNVACKIAIILFSLQCVKYLTHSPVCGVLWWFSQISCQTQS